jgi:hypothetical protein
MRTALLMAAAAVCASATAAGGAPPPTSTLHGARAALARAAAPRHACFFVTGPEPLPAGSEPAPGAPVTGGLLCGDAAAAALDAWFVEGIVSPGEKGLALRGWTSTGTREQPIELVKMAAMSQRKQRNIVIFDGGPGTAQTAATFAELDALQNVRYVFWPLDDAATRLVEAPPDGFERVATAIDLRIAGLWASSTNDLWLVGTGLEARWGGATHWDGKTWSTPFTNKKDEFTAIGGTGPNDVWISGTGVYHFDGKSWSTVVEQQSGQRLFDAVVVLSAKDIWFIDGWWGLRRHWNGKAIETVPPDGNDPVTAMWQPAAGELWSATYTGALRGSEVQPVTLAPRRHSMGGSGKDDVWIFGEDRDAWHWSKGAWTRVELPEGSQDKHLWSSSEGLWLVDEHLLRWSGNQWVAVPGARAVKHICGAGDDLWISDVFGRVFHHRAGKR